MLLFSSQAPVRQAIVVRFNRHTKGSNRAQLTSHVYKGLNSWHLIHLGNCPPQCKKSRVGEKNIRRVTSQKKLPERWAAQSTGRRDTPRYDAGKLPLLSKEQATVATPSFLGQAVMCFLLPLLTRKGVVDRNSASSQHGTFIADTLQRKYSSLWFVDIVLWLCPSQSMRHSNDFHRCPS